jgi:chemotaxis protein CheZ
MTMSTSGGAAPMPAMADLVAMVRGEIASGIGEQLAEFRRFVDRRLSELSTEIHASASMAEMTEASLAAQIARVQQEVARMVTLPVADSRTSGLELEAVVQGTENAANEILEAAEIISDLMTRSTAQDLPQQIGRQVQRIFEACSFQDITSQRVRRAIQHLEQVDIMLNNIVSHDQQPASPLPEGNFGGTGADLAQQAIDKLLDF